MSVSRETSHLLAEFARLVAKWNPTINLVSSADLASLVDRHINDSLQLAATVAAPPIWADLGSGGGFPGLVAAIALRQSPTHFHLVESDRRKGAFLRNAARLLDLPNVTVVCARIEAAPALEADVVSARALAPLPRLLHYVHRHLAPTGTALLIKGRQWQREVDAAVAEWRFELKAEPSRTDPDAAVLHVSNLRPI